MTAATPTPDPAVGGTAPATATPDTTPAATPTTDTATPTTDPTTDPTTNTATPTVDVSTATANATPAGVDPTTGHPVPESDNPNDVSGDNVYMSMTWSNLPKSVIVQIRDAALAASPEAADVSISFSDPITD